MNKLEVGTFSLRYITLHVHYMYMYMYMMHYYVHEHSARALYARTLSNICENYINPLSIFVFWYLDARCSLGNDFILSLIEGTTGTMINKTSTGLDKC